MTPTVGGRMPDFLREDDEKRCEAIVAWGFEC